MDYKENKRLLRAVELMKADPNTIVGNSPRKKSRRILLELSLISTQVFFLCAIGTTLDAIRKLQSTTYVHVVSAWWLEVAKPEALARAIEHYGALLPSTQAPTQAPAEPDGSAHAIETHGALLPNTVPAQAGNSGQGTEQHHRDQLPGAAHQGGKTQVLTMSLHSLLGFLGEIYLDVPVEIDCPFDLRCLPSVHFGPAEWGVKMEFGVGIAQAIMEHGMKDRET